MRSLQVISMLASHLAEFLIASLLELRFDHVFVTAVAVITATSTT